MNLSKTISGLRAERGMTQEKPAELIGVSARESLLHTIQCEERNSVYEPIRKDPRYQTVSERL